MNKTEKFIVKSKERFGDTLDYSKVNYVTAKTKVKLTCKIHNITFEQTPDNHSRGSSNGCPKCSLIANKKRSVKGRYTTESFKEVCISRSKGDISFKEEFEYKTNKDHYPVFCNTHTIEYLQRGDSLLRGNIRCNKCNRETTGKKLNSNWSTFNQILKDKNITHTWDLSNVPYPKNNKELILLTCTVCGNISNKKLSGIMAGYGCKYCASAGGFDSSKPGILYYFRITHPKTGENLYKIGITNRTVQERYNSYDLSNITVLRITKYDIGRNALDEETRIKRQFKEFLYQGSTPFTDRTGVSEVFTKDILNKETDND